MLAIIQDRVLNDILFRRTGLGNVGHPGEDVLQKIAHVAQQKLAWDNTRVQNEFDQADKALRLPVE